MLTTLVAFAVVSPANSLRPPSSHHFTIQDKEPITKLHEVELGSGKETVVMADGSEKETVATYRVVFNSNFTPGSQETIREYRDLSVRPEKPGANFSMKSIFEDMELKDSDLLNMYLKLNALGASSFIGQDVMTAVTRFRGRMGRISRETEIRIDPNKEIQSGGWTTRKYGHKEFRAIVSADVIGSYFDGEKIVETQDLANHSFIDIGSVWLPQETPYVDQFTPDGQPDKERQVSMGGLTIEPMEVGVNLQVDLPLLSGAWGELPASKTAAGYIGDVTKANGTNFLDTLKGMGYSTPDLVSSLNSYAPEGTDMNRLNFPALENPCKSDFDAPPGLVWLPSSPGYQPMMTGARFNLRSYGFDLWAGTGDFGIQDARAMRVLCMDMDKKEPAAGVKYFPYRSNDPVITMLAKKMDESNFRGPWDQARMWIYTNKATIEEINKVLANGVGTSAYLMALADVDWAGGLDEKMLKDPKFIKPDFMMGSGAPEYASNFLMNALDELHPKKAGEWLKKNASFVLQLVGPEADADDNQHLADTLRRMTMFNAAEDREAALRFIQATQKELAELKGKLGSGRVSLYSGRNEEVSVALALVKAGYLSPTKDALAYVAEKGPGDANKALAKELMGE